ncbi:MAG: hypothetical protein LWX11_09975, partial [Firmicutes bacterium]|nr:hypothetical protein [Bacillota bacterium]
MTVHATGSKLFSRYDEPMAEAENPYFQSDQTEERPLRHVLLWRLVGYLRPYWISLLILLSLMAAGAALEVLPSEFTLRLIDHHLAKGSLAGSGPLIAAFFGFLALGFMVQLVRYVLLARVGQMAMLDLRMQLF